ncbi:MAG: TIGR01777 family oxidoreductase [Vicinamibacterales bacterium]
MRIAIAGGTGFLGSSLVDPLVRRGHEVVVLTRRPSETPPWSFGTGNPSRVHVAGWTPDDLEDVWAHLLEGADVVCNLAGASIGDARWTPARKKVMRDSRIAVTRGLVAAASSVPAPPSTFISASGISYYGSRGDEALTEESSQGTGFLAELCAEWEEAARAAASFARVVILRTALVLDRDGGVLPRMALPFRFFAGGRLGSGRQYVSWVHRTDWARLVCWLVENPTVSGPINVAAPEPVTNAVFARALGRALGRPSILPAPALALRLVLGSERADELLLASSRILPARALEHGFRFRYPHLDSALDAIYRKPF